VASMNTELDRLTGLPTQRTFFANLEIPANSGKKIGFIYADIDCMRHVNNVAGNEGGDAVLRIVAQAFTKRFGKHCCRYGGEQFLAVWSCADRMDVLAQAEAIRADVAALIFPEHREVALTIRVGIAVWPEDANSIEELLRRADDGLYRAKKDGGNCVRSA